MPTTAVETITDAESAERAGITIRNPRTGDVLWTVPEAGPEAVARAVDVARSAASDWASTPLRRRGGGPV
ncbi:aldehyde dehydrogenase family protein, partial [Pseudarthrobacter sp. NKDBFgelt]|uniref:aldehyde dehydrogenase family protein n=1 Tax=Pseudarthrobacter sp. NKDBFgelt TaxID=3384443 RepID=UPI0038D3D394